MSLRVIGCIAFSLILGLSATPAPADQSKAQPRPNVLLISVDDLNTKLGCYGADWVRTPNIDRLAKRGVRFDRAYAQMTFCNPSRASMLTGLYPEAIDIFSNKIDGQAKLANTTFMPEAFQKAGYHTASAGKLYNSQPMRGLDEQFTKHKGRIPKNKIVAGASRKRAKTHFPWRKIDAKANELPDGKTARIIVELLEKREGKDEPFFISAGFARPHVPHQAPLKYFEMHPPERMPLLGVKGEPLGIPARGKQFANLKRNPALQRTLISRYAAATSFMDAQVGRILDAMDRLKLWDNTIVVLWSDHGWLLGEHNRWAKVSLLDPVTRAPLIIAGSGVQSGASKTPVEMVDIYPTLIDLCQLSKPHKMHGQSLRPVLEDPSAQPRWTAYSVNNHGQGLARVVRTRQWAWFEYPRGQTALYRSSDHQHKRNLTDEPRLQAVREDMKRLMERTKQRASQR